MNLFNISACDYRYMNQKNDDYKKLLYAHLKIEIDSKFLTELRTNCYSDILINSTNSDIIKEIEIISVP
jgi:ferritin-like protein